ncbi:phosphatidylcholine and lysophosphatidylcholine phospholipase [Kickxella alabastrina]|uniref:Phosphatidylcholine and lysophosphatidylcholine phospholipase n=1 Tax=Kickxella alabastrina TaxID=61397 RepID=A0ACC1ISZ0_9FUNG|nr:phosphatidylcholine and lysophosphatidylcholine phospholipase [Kickxella alabastrina]
MAVVWTAVIAGFLVFDVLVPTFTHTIHFLVHATSSTLAIVVLVAAGGVAGLYYFRYYYIAPKRLSPRLKDDIKAADGSGSGFDLHPDITRSDDVDGTNYMASLEARGNTVKQGMPTGIGFPADFLSMFLKSISIFGYIEEPVFREFSRQLQTRRLLAGECMFDTDGDRDDQNFYVVIDGQVQVYLVDSDNSQADLAAAATAARNAPAGSGAGGLHGSDNAAGAFSGVAPRSSWHDVYDGIGIAYSPDFDSGSSAATGHRDSSGTDAGYFKNVGADVDEDNEDGQRSAESVQESSAVLLNVVGPGDVLSSLFSILSLFTEDVPLKPSSGIVPKRSSVVYVGRSHKEQQQALADFSLGGTMQHSADQQTHSDIQPHAHFSALPGSSDSQDFLAGAAASGGSPIQAAAGGGVHYVQQHDHASQPPSSAYFHNRLPRQNAHDSKEARAPRPNVIARATTDTTLAMIPGSAFQRVTRLYPKAATHILQVILTRLQRVTFATLYDYLDLPHELVNVERALSELAKVHLPAEIQHSSVLRQISSVFSQGEVLQPAMPLPPPLASPMLRTRRQSVLSSRTSPAVTSAADMSDPGVLHPAWRVDHHTMVALARQNVQPNLTLVPVSVSESSEQSNSGTRHRRSGSDADIASKVPLAEDIDALRTQVLLQLCVSIGLDPHTSDGRSSSSPGENVTSSAASTTSDTRHPSTNRRQLPRTEHLLPLLQTISMSEKKRIMSQTHPMPLLEIPSLANELELYHLPNDFALVEQGKRPQGLYIILDGRVEVTHRDSVVDFTGAIDARDDAVSRSKLSEATHRMTELAREANVRIESLDPKAQAMKSGLTTTRPRVPRISPPLNLAGASRKGTVNDRAHQPYLLRAGDIVGYLPALTDMASLYTARSRGNVVVGFVSRWALDRISERFPIILMTLARRLTARLPASVLNIDYALEWVQVKASQMVYRQGEVSDAVYVVLSGRLRAFSEQGGAASILAEYGQGQSVGEPNLLLDAPSRFNLHAIRDSELVRIPTALFKALMQTAPRLTFHLSRTLAVRAAQSLQSQDIQAQSQSTVLTSGVRCHNRNLKSIAIIPINADVPVHAFAEQLEQTLADIAGQVALLDHTAVSRVLGRHAFSRIAGLKIVSWIAELEQRCRLLLHVADGGISSQWTRHCVRHSDFILLVGLGEGDPAVGDFERLLLGLKTTARKELVLLHENRSCRRGTTREWLRRRPWVHAHHHVQMPSKTMMSASSQGRRRNRSDLADTLSVPPLTKQAQGPLGLGRIRISLERYYRRVVHEPQFTPATSQGHRSDLARLSRYLCGTSVGVVLSGGGARGIALLGVLQAFEEAGIPVDMVGGTSIGALMAGLYAQTPDSVAIHGPLRAFSRRMSSLWRFLLDITYPILAYTTGREFNRAIWKVFRESEIEDLWLPFYCLTANITQSRPEVHTTGLLWRVVRASMSLGGFVPPLCDERGDLLVDGGYLDNLPVSVMKTELGADMIFAIDIAGENDTSPVRYGASVSGFWVLLNHLNPLRSYWIPTLSEVQSRLTYASSDRELESAKIADSCVYLRVPPRDVGVLDFGRFDEVYRRGYEYARQWTAAWQQHTDVLDQWRTPSGNPAAPRNQSAANGSTAPAVAARLTRRNSV